MVMTGSMAGDGQRRPPVADPVHVLFPAVPEHLRIRPAPVEPQHDRRARRRGLPQLRQRLGQRDRQAGRLPGHEQHRPPVMRGDVGVRAASLRLAALVVPALGDRLGAGVGDEMVIDVIDPGGDRVGGQHRPGGHLGSASGSAASATAASRGRRVRRCGSTASPASGPAHAAVRCLTCSVVCAPSAKHMLVADSKATSANRYPPAPCPAPAAASSTCLAPARAVNACSSIAPAYRDQNTPPVIRGPSGPGGGDGGPPPAPPRAAPAGSAASPAPPTGSCCSRSESSPGPAPAAVLEPAPVPAARAQAPPGVARPLPPPPARGQAAGHRSPRHAQPPADLQIRFPLRTPLPRQVPLIFPQRPRAARAVLPGQRRRAIPRRGGLQPGPT